MPASPDTTELLRAGRQGEKEALDELVPLIHDELRQIAHRLLQRRPAGRVLDTTELVHEAYLKLVDHSRVDWADQAHFQALSARAMRQILIDHFRKQQTPRGGGKRERVTFEPGRVPVHARGEALLALDEALTLLQKEHERLAQVVTMRFFGGMSHPAIARVLGLSRRTVQRDWRAARAWLKDRLTSATLS